MPIRIIDTIKQQNDQPFPVVDSNDVKGGCYNVADISDRDAIPSVRRTQMMLCSVAATGKTYQLIGGVDNSNWVEFTPGAYVHPNDGGGSIATALTGSKVVSQIVVNNYGHVTGTATRDLTPTDIGAANTVHNHDDLYYTKTELVSTGGSHDKIDWSQIANVPAMGSDKWLDPVADATARDAITGMASGDMVLVQNDGDGKAAQYVYNGTSWVKIADVDWTPLTPAQIKEQYESNADTNAFTDVDKTKLDGLTNYTLPTASADTLGGIKLGDGLTIDSNGVVTANGSGYTHPSYIPVNDNIQTTGAVVLSGVDLTSDSTGHLTKAEFTTRTLTYTDLGLPEYTPITQSVTGTGPTVVSDVNFTTDSAGNVTTASFTTRDLTPADIGASPSNHNHDTSYYTKFELVSTGGSHDKIDWSQLANVPSFGSDKWLDPVATIAARDAITGMASGDMVLVQDDGDGKAAQYAYNGTAWVKIADVDWTPLTAAQIKEQYESNADTNAFTDAEKIKLGNLANYSLPRATADLLGGVKIGTGINLAGDGTISVTPATKQCICLSFTADKSLELLGSTVTSLTFNWYTYGDFNSQSINNGVGTISSLLRSTTAAVSINTDTTYTLSITDDNGTSVKQATVAFKNNIIWGNSILPGAVDNTFLNTLTASVKQSPILDFEVNAGANEYIWFAHPVSFGRQVIFITAGGEGGFTSPTVVSYTNSAGHTEDYYVYRSNQVNLGDTVVSTR